MILFSSGIMIILLQMRNVLFYEAVQRMTNAFFSLNLKTIWSKPLHLFLPIRFIAIPLIKIMGIPFARAEKVLRTTTVNSKNGLNILRVCLLKKKIALCYTYLHIKWNKWNTFYMFFDIKVISIYQQNINFWIHTKLYMLILIFPILLLYPLAFITTSKTLK